MHFHELHPLLPTWMSDVETRLSSLFDGEFSAIQRAGMSVVASQGKRLRPTMLLLSCAAFGEITPRAITQACLVELVHTASLVHDDVVDEADLRRGAPSARAQWGNKFAILFGDFLLGRVFELATEDNDPEVLRILAPTATEMGRGVILELSSLDPDADEEVYTRVTHGKTAVLFGAATQLGALIGDASADEQHTMRRMGEAFGFAFQMADDHLDLCGSTTTTGKPAAIDWQQRRATLPLLYAVRHASPAVAAEIRALWTTLPFTDEHFQALRFLVQEAGGFEYSGEKVKEYLEEAYRCIESLPHNPGSDALRRLCTDRFPLPVLPSKV